ncbi:hypothetical protein ACXWTF_12985 [Thiomicrolovo sp. ZZH C-3]
MATKRIYKDILKTSAERVSTLLSSLEPVVYTFEGIDPARLFLVDAGVMAQLVQIGREHDMAVSEAFMQDDRFEDKYAEIERKVDPRHKHDFSHVIKLVNPDMSAHTYGVHRERRYKSVTDPRKVRDEMPGELERWANSRRSSAEQSTDVEDRQEVRAKIEKDIVDKERTFKKVVGSYEKYEVRILSKERAKKYATLTYSCVDDDGKRKSGSHHLAISTLNALWYQPLRYRPNDTNSEFIRKAEELGNVIGDIYFIRKDQE